MIISKLKGGLGNQLFQYALGRKLALNHKTLLKLDISGLGKNTLPGDAVRQFALSNYKIEAEIATDAEILQYQKKYNRLQKFYNKIVGRIIGDRTVVFNSKILETSNNSYLDGYWQSPLYFNDIRDNLLKELTPKDNLSDYGQGVLNTIKNSNSVGIHIRRGDYVSNSKVRNEFGSCSISYYKNAISLILEKQIETQFFVFSDDITWVKEYLTLPKDTNYVSDTSLKDSDELYLMSQCKHNIIANSSFSWWAAWLNDNPKKTVIAPTPWFDNVIYDKNLIPETWIQIKK